jgi:P4 family phage/plasmid primase-like protien
MNPTVEDILRLHYVDDAIHTHVSMVQPRGKFQFDRQKLEIFWDIYSNRLLTDDNPILGIAEKPQYYLPVLADVDLKIKDDGSIEFGDHLYNNDQALQVIEVYQSVLRNIVDQCTDNHLLCVLLEKPIYYITTGEIVHAKNGFHLHFPNLFLNKADQEVHLIPRVQEIIDDLKIFESLGISNVIDNSCCKVPWLMYQSRKAEDMKPYKVSKVFNSVGTEISLEDAFSSYKLYDNNEKLIKLEGRVKEYLPRILSIIPYGRMTNEVKQGLAIPINEKQTDKKTRSKENNTYADKSVVDSLKISAKLLTMMAQFRSDVYTEWMTIGWVLYNVGHGCSEALEQWLDFSRCSEVKFEESVCIYEWDRMIKKDLTLGTLHYYASVDSPDIYKKWKDSKSEELIIDSLEGSHNDIAKILYSEYGNEFVCASIANKTWYQFRDNRWEEIEEGIFLRTKISDNIADKYTSICQEINNKIMTSTDKAEAAMHSTRLKQVHKLIANLKCAPFKSNIMKEAMEVFYDRRFKEKLDQDPYLIGFKNGVYDLKACIHRPGRPEDFISKCIPIDYTEFDESDEEVQNIIEFLQKVFPDSSIRRYFLDTYSDVFVGGNSQKKVYLWTGEGDNAKSITQSFFEKMLGELAIKFNTQYFTGKKASSGSANPELARAAPPVRHATMEEPDADEQLNIGELKKLSGGDSYWARDLFEKGKSTREVFPMFMITFICNKLPKLKYSDKATWNRLRVIPFESIFVDSDQECPTTLEEQILQKRFPMDKTFSQKIPGMVPAFAWYLLQWRQKVTIRIEPEKVREATAIYRRQNDIYRQFIEECILDDPKNSLSLTEIYVQFKEWYREGWSNMNVPIKNEVKEYFERLWGESDRGCKWKGYRIMTMDDRIESGETVILDSDDLVDYTEGGKALPPM